MRRFVGSERGAARRILEDWKNANRAAGMSLATTRRRLSSLLALLHLAHEFDVIPWSIRLKLPGTTPIRDTRGPGRQAIMRMISLCRERGDDKGQRDTVLLSLMFYNALRASEVLSIDLAHVDLQEDEVSIAPKGKWDRQRIPIPRCTKEALERWLEVRGDEPGPLFPSMQPHRQGRADRLTYRGLYELVRKLGRQVGVACHPHGLRHTAASDLDRLTYGNVAWGMHLTRHADPKTFLAYRDGRTNHMRAAAEILAHGQYVRTEPADGRF